MSAAKTAAKTAATPAAKPAAKRPAKPAAKSVAKLVAGRERLINLLVAPHVTEKTTRAQQESNQYTFRVQRDATRTEVRAAVELMFSVKVAGVQVLNEAGKTRRFGRTQGRTQDWKKAYVRLAAGQSIDYEAAGKA